MRRLPALLPVLALASCSGVQEMLGAAFERPRLAIESLEPTGADLEGVTLTLRLRVDNPNAVGLELASLDYQVQVDGRSAVAGSTRKRLAIPSLGSAALDVPVRVRYADVSGLLRTLFSREELALRVEGTAGVATPVGVVVLPFARDGRLPVPRPPAVSIAGVALQRASLDAVAFVVELEVENPNGFDLPGGALAYGLRLGGSEVLSGARQAIGEVPARGKAKVVIPVRIPVARAADAAGKLAVGGRAEVRLDGSAHFGSVELPVSLGGTLGR